MASVNACSSYGSLDARCCTLTCSWDVHSRICVTYTHDHRYCINVTLPDDASQYVHRIGRVGRAERMGLAISLVGAQKEKVWYCHQGCPSKGKLPCSDTRLKDKGGCTIWYDERQFLRDVEEHLGITVPEVGKDMSIPTCEFDGKVVYVHHTTHTQFHFPDPHTVVRFHPIIPMALVPVDRVRAHGAIALDVHAHTVCAHSQHTHPTRYGEKKGAGGSGYQGHAEQLAPSVADLARLESAAQVSYLEIHSRGFR